MGQNYTSCRENLATHRETDGSGCWGTMNALNLLRTCFGGNSFKALVFFVALLSNVNANATGSCYSCQPPTIKTHASSKTVECSSSSNNEFQSWLNNKGGAVASCSCGKPIIWTNNCAGLSNGCGNTGEATVIFTAKGDCGKTATTKATFKIVDTKAPVITKQASNQSMACGSSCQTSFQSWLNNRGGATATDNCGSVSWSHNCNVSAPNCGSVTVVFTAKDECGNKSTTQATFSVTDSSPPTITKQPSNQSMACGSSCNSSFQTWLNTAGGAKATDNCGSVSWSHDCRVTAPNCGSVTVIFTAKDECGNKATAKGTFTVTDNTPPTITKQAQNASTACGSSCNNTFQSWLNNNGGATATDNCGKVTWSHDCNVSAPSGCDYVYVTFTAKDECGNKATTKAKFSVTDGTAPVITKQAQNASEVCGSTCNSKFQTWLNNNGGATAYDNCGPVTWSHDCNVSAPSGCDYIYVTFTAKDNCGNKATTKAKFSVTDYTAPVITKQAQNASAACGSTCNNTFQAWLNNNGGATASDNCGPVTWSHDCRVSAPDGCGYVYVTFTAKDNCGNKATTKAKFSVTDGVAPTITKQAQDKDVPCGISCNNDFQAWLNSNGGAKATDNCGSVSWSHDCRVSAPTGCGCVWVTFTAKDECGNKATTKAKFCVTDNTPPTITRNPTKKTVNCGSTCGNDLQAWLYSNGGAKATDNCGGVTWSHNCNVQNPGPCGCITVVFTAKDECGNKTTVSADFCVEDNTPPTITKYPKNDSTECGQSASASIAAWLSARGGFKAYDNCGDVTYSRDTVHVAGCGNTYSVVATFKATDECNNTVTASATYKVVDHTAPVALCKNITVELVNGEAIITAADINNGSYDLCGDVTLSADTTTFSCVDEGENTVKLTVTDECGNTATCNATVTITGGGGPVFCPGPRRIDMVCGSGELNLPVLAPGDCPVIRTPTQTQFTCADIGTKTVVIYIISGNDTTVCPTTVTVTDSVWISAPGANKTITCTEELTFDAPTSCGELHFDQTGIPDNYLCSYTVTRTWWAIDSCGTSSDTVSQTVTVVDNNKPSITTPEDKTVSCLEQPVFDEPTASDSCDPNPTVVEGETTRDEGPCAGSYTITRSWYAIDGCQNQSDVVSQTITVIDTIAPTIGGQGEDMTIYCQANPLFQGPTASDLCGTVTIDSFDVRDNGNCPAAYSITRGWYATDACGNVSDTVYQTITVIDDVAPTIGGEGADATIYCPATPVFTGPTASDLCSEVTIDSFDTRDNANCGYTVTRNWYAVDACGNISDTVSQTITVTDLTAPTIGGEGADATISCPATPVFTGPTASDECSTVTIDSFDVRENGNCPAAYTITRNWYAVDACGNVSDTVSQSISVVDTTDPSIDVVASNDTIECTDVQNGVQAWLDANGGAQASDNCGTISWTNDYIRLIPGECDTTPRVNIPGGDTCNGFRTQTMGGWGAPPNGNNPAMYLKNNFAGAFPTGLTVGCNSGFTIHFDAPVNIQNYLPAGGGSAALAQNYVNPVATLGNLSGQVTALALSLGFDAYDPNFGASPFALKNQIITTGTFQGWTVQQLFDEASKALGGCPSAYSLDDLKTGVDLINNNYVGGTQSNGYLNCVGGPVGNPGGNNGNCCPNSSATVTFTATDECGNTATTQATIVVVDHTAPTIGGQGADATISCPATPVFTSPIASDECSEVTVDSTTNRVDEVCGYTVTRSWWAVDACGNRSQTVSQSITVVDNTAPTIGGQGPNSSSACNGTPVFTAPTASDECSAATVHAITPDDTTGSGCNISITRSWYAVDECGNYSDTVSQTIAIVDTTKPVLSGQGGDMSIYCIAAPKFTPPTASDNCDPNPTITATDSTAPGNCPGTYSLIRTWIATDACGNVSEPVSQTIKIVDYNAPKITAQGGDKTISCPGVPVFNTPKIRDNCSTPTLDSTEVRTEGNCPQSYSITRKWWATDGCGNVSDTVSQTITVVDTTNPTPVCKNISIVLVNGHASIVAADVDGGSSDNCGKVTISVTPADFDCADLGPNTVTLTVTDECGNTATCEATVTVEGVGPEVSVNDTTICLGEEATLTAESAGDSPTYLWSTGATTQSITVSPASTTTYYVTVTTGGGCTASDSGTVTVRFVDLQVSNDTTICLGECVQLFASGADFYSWTPLAGLNDSTVQNPLACPTQTTTYTVTGFVPDLGGNLVVNGDFSAGNSGFGSDYGYVAPGSGPNSLVPEGLYAVDKNPNDYHPRFFGQDHTNGRGNFMIINGSPDPGDVVWEQTINGITPNSTYFFSTWIAALNNIDVSAKLTFSINGVPLGLPIMAPADSFNWKQFYTTWNSGAATSAHISIVNEEVIRGGNDFGLDDIMFTTGDCPATEEVTVTVIPGIEAVCKPASEIDTVFVTFGGDSVCIEASAVDGGSAAASLCGYDSIWLSKSCFSCADAGYNDVTLYVSRTEFNGSVTVIDSCETQVFVKVTIPVNCPGPQIVDLSCGAIATPPVLGPLPGPCGRVVSTPNIPSFGCADIGQTITVTYTVVYGTDTAYCFSDVTVVDTVTIGEPGDDVTVNCPVVAAEYFQAPLTTECDTLKWFDVRTPGNCDGSYSVTRGWYAVDSCGIMSDTVYQTVTVIDTVAPTIGGQGANAQILCNQAPVFTSPVASDLCSTATIDSSDSRLPGNCPQSYTLVRTWWATDACGNVSESVSQSIEIIDTIKPVLSGQGSNKLIACTETPAFTSPSVSDLCDPVPAIDSIDVRKPGNCPQSYSICRKWWATDACGNVSDTVRQTIMVRDLVAPTVSGQGANATIVCPAEPVFQGPTVSDLCDPNPKLDSTTTGKIPGACANAYSITRSWWATDACGNRSATVSQTITVIDNVRPTIGGQGADEVIHCPATPVFTSPTAFDACGAVTIDSAAISAINGDCPNSYTTTRFWWAIDACGNHSDTVSQNITVIDTIAPTIGGQGEDMTIYCQANPLFHGPTASDLCGDATIDSFDVREAGNCPAAYTLTRGWYATDACGNVSDTVYQTITVIDDVAPTIGGEGADATIYCPETPVFSGPTASDLCSAVTIDSFDTRNQGRCVGSYSVTRGWYATDECGNVSDTVYQTITVIDIVAPTIGGQGEDVTIYCEANPLFHGPTASDLCSDVTIDSFDVRVAGDCPAAYTLTRGWYATDACGNVSDTVYQTVTVIDNVAPTIGGEGADATIACPGTPVFSGPTASDLCSAVAVDSFDTRTEGRCVGSYSVTRGWYATDECGNVSDTVYQTITVVDNTAPVLTPKGQDGTVSCDLCINGSIPGFHKPEVDDLCDPNPTLHTTDVTVAGSCPSNYTVTRKWWAVDACGNVSDTVYQTIEVIDTTAPELIGQGADKTVSCSSIPAFKAPGVRELCGTYQLFKSDSYAEGSCPEEYSMTRKWWAVDACGNVSDTVSQTITVTDNNKPVLSGQGADIDYGCTSCQSCVPNFFPPIVQDECDNFPTLTHEDDTIFGNCNSYSITRTWTAVDACGNVSDPVSQTISVGDHTAPVLTCQPDETVDCGDDWSFTDPTVSDECDRNPTVAITTSDSTVANPNGSESHIRVWTAVDACGNTSTCSQVITVLPCDLRTVGKSTKGGNNTIAENTSGIARFVAYPNPAQTTVTFSMLFNSDETNVTVELLTVDGRRVASLYQGAVIKGSEYLVPFDVTILPAGTYLYRLTTNDNSVVERLTIVR